MLHELSCLFTIQVNEIALYGILEDIQVRELKKCLSVKIFLGKMMKNITH